MPRSAVTRHGVDAERILAELQAGRGPANPAEAGDPTLLPAGLEDASPQEISGSFGDEFGKQLEDAPVNQWAGPICFVVRSASRASQRTERQRAAPAGRHPSRGLA